MGGGAAKDPVLEEDGRIDSVTGSEEYELEPPVPQELADCSTGLEV